MNSREEFLKSLKVTNTNSTRKGNRYKSDIKAKEIAQRPGVLKKAAALIMAGGIIGVGSAGISNYFSNSKPQHTTNPHQIEMVNKSQSNIPAEIYLPNKEQYDKFQKDVTEYKKLDNVLFKNDEEEKRFAELQNIITKQHEFIENFSLDLIKYKVAKDHGIERYSDLRLDPRSEEGQPLHSVYNKRSKTKITYQNLDKSTLNAINDIHNFQCKRKQQGKYIPTKNQAEILKLTASGKVKEALVAIDKHSLYEPKFMSEIIVELNDQMMNFSKSIDKNRDTKNITKVAMKKDDDMER